jgi:hypothetical protein
MNQSLTLVRWIIPVALILMGWFFGIIFEKFFFSRFKRFTTRMPFPGNELVIESLQKLPSLWLFFAGLYGAILALTVTLPASGILQKALTATFLYTVTLLVARLAAGFVTLYSQRIEGLSASLFSNLTRILVLLLGILIILQAMGISITPYPSDIRDWGISCCFGFSGYPCKLIFWFILNHFRASKNR